jgi:hypothetical protein
MWGILMSAHVASIQAAAASEFIQMLSMLANSSEHTMSGSACKMYAVSDLVPNGKRSHAK